VRRGAPPVGRPPLLRRRLTPRRRNCPPAVLRGRSAIRPSVVLRAASRRLKTYNRARSSLSCPSSHDLWGGTDAACHLPSSSLLLGECCAGCCLVLGLLRWPPRSGLLAQSPAAIAWQPRRCRMIPGFLGRQCFR